MKYAIVSIKGKQYKVSEGDQVQVALHSEKEKIEPVVLLARDGEKIEIGSPEAKKAKVTVKALENIKGEKITVNKYKSKSRYRRKMGFRPQFTKIEVQKISL